MRQRLTWTTVVLLVLGLVVGAGTMSAFSGTTANPANTFSAGTVALTDNDSGSAMFTLTGLKPGDTQAKCIQITYTGSLPSTVHLYGTAGGSGLAAYLDLQVTRGTVGSGGFDDCSGFSADTTDYSGLGAGVVYNGALASLPGTWAAGVVDAHSTVTETWSQGETHAYRFQVTLQDTNAAQGLSASPTFTWEARNLNLACAARSTVWTTGMEHGSNSTGLLGSVAATGGGSITADTSVVRSGSYSLKLAKVNGGQTWINKGGIGSPSTVAGRVAIRFESLPATDISEVVSVAFSGFRGYVGYSSSSQKLLARFQGGTTGTAATTVAAGQWYVIDFLVNATANPNTLDWRIDGVGQPQATRASGAATATMLSFGSSLSTEVFTTYYDDMVFTSSAADYPIGDGHVLGLVPNGVGTVDDAGSNLKDDDGTAVDATSWQRLDERPVTSMGDYVKQTGVDAAASMGLTFQDPAGTGCVNGVSAVLTNHSSSTTANDARTSVFDGSTERVLYSGDMSPGGTLEYRSAAIAPAAGAWDTTKLDGLTARLGYATSVGSQPYWDALLVEYDLTPV
jgi:hypothetical protein